MTSSTAMSGMLADSILRQRAEADTAPNAPDDVVEYPKFRMEPVAITPTDSVVVIEQGNRIKIRTRAAVWDFSPDAPAGLSDRAFTCTTLGVGTTITPLGAGTTITPYWTGTTAIFPNGIDYCDPFTKIARGDYSFDPNSMLGAWQPVDLTWVKSVATEIESFDIAPQVQQFAKTVMSYCAGLMSLPEPVLEVDEHGSLEIFFKRGTVGILMVISINGTVQLFGNEAGEKWRAQFDLNGRVWKHRLGVCLVALGA